MAETKLNRRTFLKASVMTVLGAAVQACAQPTPKPVAQPTAKPAEPTKPPASAPTATPKPAEPTKPAAPAPTATAKPAEPTKPPATKFKEAPMLAELVKAGKLPPVEERLPINPDVCPTLEGIGKYGGSFRRGFNGVSDGNGPAKVVAEGVTWYTKDLAVRASMCESWAINQDASEWTFKMRKGMKWSDGALWSSENAKWWYDNILLNKTLTPTVSDNWGTGAPRQVMKLETPDQFTVVLKFAHPKPLQAFTMTRQRFFAASHYVKKFHLDTTPDKAALEKEFKDKKFDAWDRYWADRTNQNLNPELPNLGPWIYKQPISGEMFILERNPYFWQVDAEGNQLPYVDKVPHRLFSSPDVLNMWIINGEIDFQNRHVSFANYTLYKTNEAKGKYKVFLGVSAGHVGCQLNLTTKNKLLREFFNTRDVRIALSHAINRAQVNDLLYEGLAVPRQYSPLKLSPQYYQKASEAYIAHDPKKANELLDKAGYSKKGGDGIRLHKDGTTPISFIIEGTTNPGTPDEDAILMVCKQWQTVGVKATYKYAERALYTQHFNANEIEAAWWGGDRTVLPIVAPWIFLGTMVDRPWACAWGHWRNDPTNQNAEEPPKDHWIRKIWDIWDKVAVEPNDAKRNELFRGILDIWAEECPMVIVLGEVPAPIIVKEGIKGYPNGMPIDDTTEDEHLLNPQTYYWSDDPSKHAT